MTKKALSDAERTANEAAVEDFIFGNPRRYEAIIESEREWFRRRFSREIGVSFVPQFQVTEPIKQIGREFHPQTVHVGRSSCFATRVYYAHLTEQQKADMMHLPIREELDKEVEAARFWAKRDPSDLTYRRVRHALALRFAYEQDFAFDDIMWQREFFWGELGIKSKKVHHYALIHDFKDETASLMFATACGPNFS